MIRPERMTEITSLSRSRVVRTSLTNSVFLSGRDQRTLIEGEIPLAFHYHVVF